jgi:hypothetical protein
MTIKNGCAYGQVNRQMISDMKDDISEIKGGINELNSKVTDLFNHQSNRLPMWATSLIAFLASIVSALGIWALTR